MTQTSEISQQAKEIINYVYNRMLRFNPDCNPSLMLAVSLYATQSDYNISIIKNLEEYVVDLNEYLNWGESEILQSEYKQVIFNCLEHSSEQCLADKFDDMTPPSIVELCYRMAGNKEGCEIFLPYSGKGEFSRYTNGCRFSGFIEARFENEYKDWAISEMINSLNDVDSAIEVIPFPDNEDIKYDFILSRPPLKYFDEDIKYLMQIIPHNLKKEGEAYFILPERVCYGLQNELEFRKSLSNINASLTILLLPKDVFMPYTSVSVCLLRIKNDRRGDITLADFSNAAFLSRIKNRGMRKYSLCVDNILECLSTKESNTIWTGSYSDLTNELILYPKRYLPFEHTPILSEGEKLVKLGDLVEKVPFSKLLNAAPRPWIGNVDLFDDYINCILFADKLEPSIMDNTFIIEEDCLLLGYRNGVVKVAKLKNVTEKTSISLRSSIYPLKLKSDIVTEEYLLRELLSDYSVEQITRFSHGTVENIIKFSDLCEIYIKVPPTQEQEKIFHDDVYKSAQEADLKLQKVNDEYRRDIHMKKHAIGQTIANFKNWWELLVKARNENSVIDESAIIGKIHKVSVKEIFDNLDITLTKLSTQFNKFDVGYGLVKEEFALADFIENYIQENKNPLFKYEYDYQSYLSSVDVPKFCIDNDCKDYTIQNEFIRKKGDPIAYIKFPKEALTTVFDNIISNACAYGFIGREDEENIIKIEIKTLGTNYIVSISNNGNPLDAQMKPEDITVYGHTSGDTGVHYGIGGYEIKRIMEEFGDKVEIISQPDDEFPITYKLIFYDTNINTSVYYDGNYVTI